MNNILKWLLAFWMLATTATISVAQTIYVYDAGELKNLEFVGKTTDTVITIPEDIFVLMVLFSGDISNDEFDNITKDFPYETRGPKEPAFQAFVPSYAFQYVYGVDFIMYNVKTNFFGRDFLHVYLRTNEGWYKCTVKDKSSLIYTFLN